MIGDARPTLIAELEDNRRVVPRAGIEPARLVEGPRILSPLCLPFSPSGRVLPTVRHPKRPSACGFNNEKGKP
jgi:hypothetical protein